MRIVVLFAIYILKVLINDNINDTIQQLRYSASI